jgi:hypothetical protein
MDFFKINLVLFVVDIFFHLGDPIDVHSLEERTYKIY